MKTLDWYGLYKANWNAAPLVPEAYAHPAKVAFGLAQKIYEHCIEQGYIRPGDRIVDPFGGIAGFAFHAMRNGLHWHGVELEQKFVDLGNQNITFWNERYAQWFREWGTAQTIQGDSRRLSELVAGAQACVGSPPFHDQMPSHDNFTPPHDTQKRLDTNYETSYGTARGQLGAMKEGNLDAAISSPPYADAVSGSGEGPGARHDPIHHKGDNSFKNSSDAEYGDTPGNLGNMAACVSSPPYERSMDTSENHDARQARTNGFTQGMKDTKYGQNPHTFLSKDPSGLSNQQRHEIAAQNPQVGALKEETFWTAARTIVEQVYMVLKPGGYAIFVTKDFVRNKERVPFSDQWQVLCEACGFVPVERIRAWVIEERGTQGNLFTGEFETKMIERKSFFRRLAERKGSPRIDWEDVLILRKPL